MVAPYRTETAKISHKRTNENFVKKIMGGRTKEAELKTSEFIRTELREEAFSRKIFTPELLTAEDLDKSANTDLPMKYVPIEPDSAATFVPFRGTAKRRWFHGKRFPVYMGKIRSETFQKDKFELMTYDEDIVKIISDNSVKDMAAQEDAKLMTALRNIISTFPTQKTTASGGLNAANVSKGAQALIKRRVPLGMILCTESLYMDLITLPATSIGDLAASRQYDSGLEDKKSLWGIPCVTTIKNDLVKDNELWFFAAENYLGKHYLLQDATMYIEQKGPMLEFYSYMALGIGLGAHKGIQLVEL